MPRTYSFSFYPAKLQHIQKIEKMSKMKKLAVKISVQVRDLTGLIFVLRKSVIFGLIFIKINKHDR